MGLFEFIELLFELFEPRLHVLWSLGLGRGGHYRELQLPDELFGFLIMLVLLEGLPYVR